MKINEDPRTITMSQTNLAKGLGLSVNRVQQLVAEGVVVRDDNDSRGGVYLLQSLHNYWRNKYAGKTAAIEDEEIDINRERALHEAADRKMAELKLAKMENRVYDARTVELVMTEMLSNLRTQLLGLPSKLAPQMENMKKEQVYECMSREIEDKLSELSEYKPELFTAEEIEEAGNEER